MKRREKGKRRGEAKEGRREMEKKEEIEGEEGKGKKG